MLVLVSEPGLQMAELDSGSDDSDLVSTSESGSDEDMEDEEAQDAAEGGDADVEMATSSGAALDNADKPNCLLRTVCVMVMAKVKASEQCVLQAACMPCMAVCWMIILHRHCSSACAFLRNDCSHTYA